MRASDCTEQIRVGERSDSPLISLIYTRNTLHCIIYLMTYGANILSVTGDITPHSRRLLIEATRKVPDVLKPPNENTLHKVTLGRLALYGYNSGVRPRTHGPREDLSDYQLAQEYITELRQMLAKARLAGAALQSLRIDSAAIKTVGPSTTELRFRLTGDHDARITYLMERIALLSDRYKSGVERVDRPERHHKGYVMLRYPFNNRREVSLTKDDRNEVAEGINHFLVNAESIKLINSPDLSVASLRHIDRSGILDYDAVDAETA